MSWRPPPAAARRPPLPGSPEAATLGADGTLGGHSHRPVRGRRGGELALRGLAATRPLVEPAEPGAAVGFERPHGQPLGGGEGVAIQALGLVTVRGIAAGRDLGLETQGVDRMSPLPPVPGQLEGLLRALTSSQRFKEEIRSMEDASAGLLRLRPVTFRYKQPAADGSKALQYGLIAEEAAEVYPELVAYDATGQPATVMYHLLPAMLLNELQRQHRLNAAQQAELEKQQRANQAQQAELDALAARLAELTERLHKLETREKSPASR